MLVRWMLLPVGPFSRAKAALQQRIQQYFPQFTLILDFILANEYLWKAANSLFS